MNPLLKTLDSLVRCFSSLIDERPEEQVAGFVRMFSAEEIVSSLDELGPADESIVVHIDRLERLGRKRRIDTHDVEILGECIETNAAFVFMIHVVEVSGVNVVGRCQYGFLSVVFQVLDESVTG